LHTAGEINDLGQLMQRAKLLMTIDAEKPGDNLAAVQQPINCVEVNTLIEQVSTMATNQRTSSQTPLFQLYQTWS